MSEWMSGVTTEDIVNNTVCVKYSCNEIRNIADESDAKGNLLVFVSNFSAIGETDKEVLKAGIPVRYCKLGGLL